MSNQGIIREGLRDVASISPAVGVGPQTLGVAQMHCDPTTCASGLYMVTRGNFAPPKVPHTAWRMDDTCMYAYYENGA